MTQHAITLSVLDLCSIAEGATAATALHNALELAQHTEALGYRRFWVAEHHNMTGIASAATSVVRPRSRVSARRYEWPDSNSTQLSPRNWVIDTDGRTRSGGVRVRVRVRGVG